MILITQTPNSITVCGHANSARRGRDIVCASVSVLLQNLIVSIEELTADKIEYEKAPGDYVTEYNKSSNGVSIKFGNLSERAQLLIDSFFIGVTAIANTCPDYVKVTKH